MSRRGRRGKPSTAQQSGVGAGVGGSSASAVADSSLSSVTNTTTVAISVSTATTIKTFQKPVVIFKIKDKVEGNFRNTGKWHSGHIDKVNFDGTYNVRYDDSDHESFVDATRLRRICKGVKPSAVLAALPFEKGTKVRVNFRGKGLWYPGSISRVHADGTFYIDYDDGEKETFVPKLHVQLPADPSFANNSLKEGYTIEANFANEGRWYPAIVSSVHSDNTYDVHYEDGRTEVNVQLTSLRQDTAKITPNSNTTYTVVYLDGRVERKVDKRRVTMPTVVPVDHTNAVNILLSWLVFAVIVLILVECVKIRYMGDEGADEQVPV